MRIGRAAPYLGAMAVVALSAGLIGTIYLTTVDLHWLVFLAGVLMAASIALASSSSTSAWTIARRTSQLAAARARLATESALRTHAEQALAGVNRTARYAEDLLPAMLSYIDADRRLQYHNRAYVEWLGMPGARLEGRPVAELLGVEAWREIGPHLDEAFAGSVVRYERVQATPDLQCCRVAALYLPHFGDQGRVVGVFCVLADVTRPEDCREPGPVAAKAGGANERALYSSTIAGELTAWRDVADRLRCALDRDEFVLYAQAIEPALADARAAPFLEILLRLREEEDNLIPPGAFLPLAEEYGLLPEIDRWVVRRLLAQAAAAPRGARALYSVNVSAASIADPGFVDFVRDLQREAAGRGPGLCFEFNEAEAMSNLDRTVEFVRDLASEGCRFALSSFGRDPVSFTLPKRVPFDYIKIDAGIVLASARSPVELAKVKAINRVAHSMGARTIAQCVESEATRALLAEAGVDFVQGFAVSLPAPLALPLRSDSDCVGVIRAPGRRCTGARSVRQRTDRAGRMADDD